MIYKEVIENELYVYHNGNLIYKRWLDTGNSIVFNNFGLPTWKRERDKTPR